MSKIKKLLPDDWYQLLGGDQYFQNKFKDINTSLGKAVKGRIFYPATASIFRCFSECPLEDLKVVIVGQDPYPNNSATGLAFGNPSNAIRLSPSLQTIVYALEDSFDMPIPAEIDITLESWAKQGVLLLNSALTVEKSKPGSHAKIWEPFTKHVLNRLVDRRSGDPIIFVFMGKVSQQFITADMEMLHDVFRVAHPAAESYNPSKKLFSKSKIFKQINDRLEFQEKPQIDFLNENN